ncbi:helicase associated domain-containing protein [Streptomyces longwoodensis]|uniref:helicase associated domain-containing protein n=1 Tax=Streptomyces longwoodensis TaxID=68231 RepID=UPI003F57091D
MGAIGAARLGPAHDRAAVPVRAGPRDRARQRGREAAKQLYEREGHLQVPRWVERTVGEDQEVRKPKLGAWVGNQRSRAVTLERMELLSAIGMRWT